MRLSLILAGVICIGPTAPAMAQEKLTIAQCKPGGCRCALSTLTMEQAGIVLGKPAPEGTKYLVYINGEYSWSRYSLREIDLVAGGDGDCPLELFDAMVPEDGDWLGTVTGRRVTQCPAGLDKALDPITEAMVFPRRIAWGGQFHPDKIRMQGAAAAIRWTRVNDTQYRGEGPSAQSQGAASAAEISVSYDAKLVSPRLVKIDLQLKVRGKGASQAMIDAMGMGKCDVTIAVDLKRS